MNGQGTKCRRNIAENLNRLRGHTNVTEDRQTDRQTDGRQQIANANVSSRSLTTERNSNNFHSTISATSTELSVKCYGSVLQLALLLATTDISSVNTTVMTIYPTNDVYRSSRFKADWLVGWDLTTLLTQIRSHRIWFKANCLTR